MTMDARQFNGTLGNAKAICSWVGDPTKACFGATMEAADDHEGGFNLVEPETYVDPADGQTKDSIRYITANPTDWVVNSNGVFTIVTDAQFKALFPNFGG